MRPCAAADLQRTNAEYGPALVGLEVARREDFLEVARNLASFRIDAEELNEHSILLRSLV